ncbi:MAG: methyl-accepting chemotaxis protein [Burkholderiaceae bacterium]
MNFTIKTRLIGVVGFLSLLTVLIGMLGLNGMNKTSVGLKTVYQGRAVPLEQMAKMHTLLQENLLGIVSVLQDPMPDKIKSETDKIDARIIEITHIWSTYSSSKLTPEEKQLADKFQVDRGRFVKEGLLPAVAALRDDRIGEVQLTWHEIETLSIPVRNSFSALRKLQVDGAKAEYDASVARNDTIQSGIFVAIALGVLLAAAAAYFLIRSILRPMHHAIEVAHSIAVGDLTTEVKIRSNDEIGQLLRAIKEMSDSLGGIVSRVRSGSDAIATASSQIAAGNLDLSSRTEGQASSLEQTAAAMEELTGTVKQNADNARQANQLAATASEVAIRSGEVVSQVVDTMAAIDVSAKKIADIISVIDGIAFQTNILALNAAVEAARAGEQGLGFAVVATEVRNLAQRSATAAKEIKSLIDDSVQKVGVGNKLVAQAGDTMEQVVISVRRVTDIMSEITAASQEQSQGIEQVNQAIAQMDEVTQQNAALVEEAAAAAQSMQQQTGNLAQVVGMFRLDTSPTVVMAMAAPMQKNSTACIVKPPAAAKTTRPVKRVAAKAPASNEEESWEEF